MRINLEEDRNVVKLFLLKHLATLKDSEEGSETLR